MNKKLLYIACSSFGIIGSVYLSGDCWGHNGKSAAGEKQPSKRLAQSAPSQGQKMRPSAENSAAAIAVLRQGTQMIDAARLPEALELYRNYCLNWPEDPKGYFWMGVCYDEMSKFDFAEQAYRDAISKAEQSGMDSSEIRSNLGNVLLKKNDPAQAIDSFKRAIEINPQYGLAHLNLGRAYIAASQFEQALKSFNKCDELHFNPRQLPYYKAKALLALGRNNEAAVLISKLLEDYPQGPTRDEIQKEFASCLQK